MNWLGLRYYDLFDTGLRNGLKKESGKLNFFKEEGWLEIGCGRIIGYR